MKFYYLRCLNQDGQTERNGNFLDRKEAEKEKAALDLYPENKRYGIEQDIIEDSVMDIVKRRPDSNGVLPLTEEELEEFAMLNKSSPNVVVFIFGGQVFCRYDKFEFSVYRYESILWLSNLFELNKEA